MVIFCQRPRWCRGLFCHGLRLRGGRCRWDLQISFSKWRPLVDGLVGCFKNFSFTFNSLLSVKPSSKATDMHCVGFNWCISIILGDRYYLFLFVYIYIDIYIYLLNNLFFLINLSPHGSWPLIRLGQELQFTAVDITRCCLSVTLAVQDFKKRSIEVINDHQWVFCLDSADASHRMIKPCATCFLGLQRTK